MIADDLAIAEATLTDIMALAPYASIDADIGSLCLELLQTVAEPDFPGAIVPIAGDGGEVQVAIAAPSVALWRRLNPVLQAFAGPTLTSFDGIPSALDPAEPVNARLLQAGPAITAIMRFPNDSRARLAGLRALLRARATLARAPDLQRAAPVQTSWLLTQFQDFLNVARRDAAAAVLERLRSELRLDALNIKFLEVQLLATFGDWASIIALPEFSSLCRARRTPAVTAYLLDALYQAFLAETFEADDGRTARQIYEGQVREFAQPLITAPAPASITVGGWRLYGLEALVSPGRVEISKLLENRCQTLGWLGDALEFPTLGPIVEGTPATPLDAAREALLQSKMVDSNDTLAKVIAALANLTPEDLVKLRDVQPFRDIAQDMPDIAVSPPPTSWPDWLSRVADPEFTAALEVARRGKDEWSIESIVNDPVAVQSMISALEQGQISDLATERTAQALPYLVAWLQGDAEFPRPGMAPVYASLLTLFALGSARSPTTFESSRILVGALLASGLDEKRYRDLIADVEEIAGDGFGVDMIYWTLEVVENFISASTPSAEARETFLHGVMARVAPLYKRLSSLQRSAVGLLATQLGWTLQSIGVADETEVDDNLSSRLAGLRIAIYSLTESSSRQAKAALEQIASSVTIDISADQGGTTRLRAMAENADLFVMVWLSAKHAATDFIREHRGSRPLLYAQGKGFSSILRAIEDYLRISS